MSEKGLQGSSSEVQALLREHNIPLDEFLSSANKVMRNPLYVGAMRMAGAPIDKIKRALATLSETVSSETKSTKHTSSRTKFQRL